MENWADENIVKSNKIKVESSSWRGAAAIPLQQYLLTAEQLESSLAEHALKPCWTTGDPAMCPCNESAQQFPGLHQEEHCLTVKVLVRATRGTESTCGQEKHGLM